MCLKLDYEWQIENLVTFNNPNSGEIVLDNDKEGVKLFQKGAFPLDRMITHICKFENIQEGFGWLENPPEGYLKGLLVFD